MTSVVLSQLGVASESVVFSKVRSSVEDNLSRAENWIVQAFADMVELVRRSLRSGELERALEGGGLSSVLQFLGIENRMADAARGKGVPPDRRSLERALQDAFQLGAEAEIKRLGGVRIRKATVGFELSFDKLNQRAVDFLRSYTFSLIRDVSRSTVEAVRDVLVRGFQKGTEPRRMAREIRSLIGLTATQAQAVESYRTALESGDERQLRGILGRALRDGRFDRSVMAEIDGIRDLKPEQIDTMVDRYYERSLKHRAVTIARTECLLADAFVDGAVVRAVYRRWYDGPVIEIVTRGGHHLTTTPNHPMLTSGGWRFCQDLAIGSYLIRHSRQQRPCFGGHHDVYRGPTALGEIFDTVARIGIFKRMPTVHDDFHGDGVNGNVDIFSADRLLVFGEFIPVRKPSVYDLLSPADLMGFRFCHFCGGLVPINQSPRCCAAARCQSIAQQSYADRSSIYSVFMRQVSERIPCGILPPDFSGGKPSMLQRGGTAVAVEELSGFAERPCNASASDQFSDPVGVATGAFSNGCGAESGSIEFDEVLDLRWRSFSGHVYNLETEHGYFTISGFYSGNSLRALNSGQQEAWRQAMEQDLLPDTARRHWLVAHDERLCPICAPVPSMNKDGVELGQVFNTPVGGVEYPPLHPSCRCSTALRIQ